MRRILSAASAAALLATATLVSGISPVAATTQVWTYGGYSGATQINALGTTISSGPTAQSNLVGNTVPDSHQTAIASVQVGTLLSAGAATSGQQATASGDGVQITSGVKIAGLSLLGGAIKADAIESYSTASASSAGLNGSAGTTFARLVIGGKALPITVAPNTKISIPGLADVVLNETKISKSDLGKTILVQNTAVHITLLKPANGAPAGAEIKLNPTQALVVPTGQSDALPVGGFAYGTFAGVKVGDSIKVLAQPTGMLSLPSSGTNGTVYTNSTAAVNVPNVLTLGAVETAVGGATAPGFSDVATGARTARLNLLNGLITADAIDVTSHVRKDGAENISEASTNFVNLKVAGKLIPINAKPNTTIYLLGIGEVIINQQNLTSGYSAVVGLRLILSTARAGLPAGADIQISVAASYIVGAS